MNEDEAVSLLKRYSDSKESFTEVLAHSKTVQKIALRIAKKIPGIDIELIKIASILHDIGRFEYPPWKGSIMHGIRGAEIIRKEGLDENIARICERHLGTGISKKDIEEQKLPLPKKDFIPKTREEKIITFADLLTRHKEEISLDEALKDYAKILGKEYSKRIIRLHDEIIGMQDEPK